GAGPAGASRGPPWETGAVAGSRAVAPGAPRLAGVLAISIPVGTGVWSTKNIQPAPTTPFRGTVNGSDCPVIVRPSTTQVTRARIGPKFVGTFSSRQVPSGWTCATRFRTETTQRSSSAPTKRGAG